MENVKAKKFAFNILMDEVGNPIDENADWQTGKLPTDDGALIVVELFYEDKVDPTNKYAYAVCYFRAPDNRYWLTMDIAYTPENLQNAINRWYRLPSSPKPSFCF